MKSVEYDQLPNCDDRIVVAVPSNLKRQIFAVATKRGIPASLLVRQALAAVMEEPQAA